MVPEGASWLDVLTAVASAVTAVSVFLAYQQLRLTKDQARISFEDALSREYRELAKGIPVKALLGEALVKDEYDKAMSCFYHYIDLSNEEVFLRQQKRISRTTWMDWCEGMKTNLSLPAFKKAWDEFKNREQLRCNFIGLRRLEASGFHDDPDSWT